MKTILVLSSHTPSLFWFRMDMMKAFLSYVNKVIAVGSDPDVKWAREFGKNNIEYRSVPISRNGLNVLADIKTFVSLQNLIREIKPDKIFTYQAKTIVYGALAARSVGNAEIYPLVAGLGSIFRGRGLKNKVIRSILSIQYKLAFSYSRKVIFQNNDDKSELVRLGLLTEAKCCKIHGSGVNTSKLTPVEFPQIPSILFIGRLIGDKGIREYLELAKRMHDKRRNVRCLLVGPYDTNPSAITAAELKPYIDSGAIEYFGEQKDIQPFMSQCTVYVLPSYHEGTPKTVLEAMSMGRPIVTTDAPGCRETVVDGVNGYLVPVKNVDALEDAVLRIIDNKELIAMFGQKSREIAVEKFDVNKVNDSIMNIMSL